VIAPILSETMSAASISEQQNLAPPPLAPPPQPSPLEVHEKKIKALEDIIAAKQLRVAAQQNRIARMRQTAELDNLKAELTAERALLSQVTPTLPCPL
jgi:hypothetical protein